MQLVAYGAQDVFLTGTPEITFWKVSYRRHTNFAMESIEQTFLVKLTSVAVLPVPSAETVILLTELTFKLLFLRSTKT
jgi:hypothetical protein